jgi:threonine dehydratase
MPSSATAASTAPPDTKSLVSLDEIRAAARVLRNIAVRTPLLPADDLSAQLGGGTIFVKPEMLQRGGAFKFRGAYTFLAGLSDATRARGVIAPSSGNHAQAVAFAARIFGIHATLVMPTTVTAAKRTGVERLGGRVELAGITTADRMERAQQLAKETGSVLVPPYDDARIIAGQGTVGLEIVEDLPDVGTVLVPVGGGGLSAGVATAVKLLAPNARVIGVEPVGAPKLSRARAAGAPVRLDATGGMADGLLATQVGTIPFAHHEAYIDEVVTIDDGDLAAAMRYLLDRLKIVTEPSGAITIAALQTGKVEPRGKTVAVLSGGNIEYDGLRSVLGDG